MALFTIRIDLFGATPKDSADLIAYLAAKGINDIITDGKGLRFKMPAGEYNYESPDDRHAVLATAKSCAERVGKPYTVLVTASAGRSWHGLPSVKSEDA